MAAERAERRVRFRGSSLIEEARSLAVRVHAGQTYRDQSYFKGHLIPVVCLLIKTMDEIGDDFGDRREEVISVGYLHDALEDAPAEGEFAQPFVYQRIQVNLSQEIAGIVLDLTRQPGPRSQMLEAHYRDVRKTEIGVFVKLADRAVNMGLTGGDVPEGLAKMYRREYPGFRSALFRGSDHPAILRLWSMLDNG